MEEVGQSWAYGSQQECVVHRESNLFGGVLLDMA